jgi:hypothetical protein
MLDQKVVDIINELIKRGKDIEIQVRKDKIAIISEQKRIVYTYDK